MLLHLPPVGVFADDITELMHSRQKEWRQGNTLGSVNISKHTGHVSSSYRETTKDLPPPTGLVAIFN